MGFQIPPPDPPASLLANPLVFTLLVVMGLLFVVGVTFLVDKLGTAMFKRGYAKPFYIKGRRIHHSCIYIIAPIFYGIVSTLFFFGYVDFRWADLWIGMAQTGLLCVACIAVDFIGDRFWPEIRKNVILHHEWIYALIPAYFFTFVVIH